MLQRSAWFLCIAFGIMFSAASAEERKTFSPMPTVNASGMVVLHPKPTILRLEMQLEAPGATAKQALHRLKTLRETALGKVRAMKSPPSSVTFSGLAVEKRSKPAPQEDADAPQGANLPMGAQPVVRVVAKPAVAPGGFPPPATVPAPPAVPALPQFPPPATLQSYPIPVPYVSFPVATISLRAEWPLKGESLEEIVGATETIKENVASLDLGRSKAAKEPSSKDKGKGDNNQDSSNAPSQTYPAGTPYGSTFSIPYPAAAARADVLLRGFGVQGREQGGLGRGAGQGEEPGGQIGGDRGNELRANRLDQRTKLQRVHGRIWHDRNPNIRVVPCLVRRRGRR